jgi:methyltransferase
VSLPQSSPAKAADATLVDAGIRVPVTVEFAIPALMRVTLRFADATGAAARDPAMREIRAEAVDPAAPRKEAGYYWGYNVRRADCLSAVYEECPFDGGYDVTIGTSERGRPLHDAAADGGIAPFRHLLLVLGGVAGLEAALAHDAKLTALGVVSVADLFDFWVNILPGQGSRTIRTEEALWIALMGIRGVVAQNAVGEGGP